MREEMAEFLRARRAALTPEQSGVQVYGAMRRVPGLRRDEVAQLASISVNYYTRLEQGEIHQLSDAVLDSLSSALQLTPAERIHLLRLSRPRPAHAVPLAHGPERLRPSVLALVESTVGQAAVVIGRYFDLLGANRLGYALYGLDRDKRVNLAKKMFLDSAMRELHPEWEREVSDLAARLRMATGDMPDDPTLSALIRELSINSPEFSRVWARQRVAECKYDQRRFRHPVVGPLELRQESMRLPDDPGQRIVFLGAEAGTDSADRLGRLEALSLS
ncbi:helix-turn-helix transcriptional regulator [Streptomyces sp. NPDC057062]|uniref:helix-turn-helix transcriptional regulator n=1 Tax=Streptomyces sp. NPDC057062 TaxID=3346011 RepID=UPI003638EBC2